MENFWQKLNKPIIGLAPMDGVTDFPMRAIQCRVAKPEVMYAEFVSVEGFCRKPENFEKTFYFSKNQRPVVAQLFGYTPELFYETILQIAEKNFDGIDLNMGCPAKSVLCKGGGGALIENYELAEKIINKSLSGIKKAQKQIPLSIKTRIGKNQTTTKEWIKFLCDFPISELTVHGRLLKQGHSGEVNWNEIMVAAEIAHQKNIVLLGNGGVKNLLDAREKTFSSGLDGVLIGQAALGNPWVFKENYHPSKKEILQTIIEHARLVNKFYGKKRYVTVLKHFSWYPKNFSGCKQLKLELLRTRSLEESLSVVEKYL